MNNEVPRGGMVSVRPGVGMLALFPSMKYKPWYALGELVDNAIQSYISNRSWLRTVYPSYTLRIDIEVTKTSIRVVDNAAGIAGSDLPRALAPAEPPPDGSGLSQFGIGLKSAACWYAKRFSVTTTVRGEPIARSVTIDLPTILESKKDDVAVTQHPTSEVSHGTEVLLENLNQPSPTGRTLGKIRSYLRSMYRTFLRSGELELTVGNERLEYREPDVLVAPRWDTPHASPARWQKHVDVFLPASGRRIRGWVALRAKGSTAEAGLALIYRGKVVVGAGSMAQDTDGSYRPIELFGRSNSFAYQRIFGELDVSQLQVAYSKDELIWGDEEEAFLQILRDELDSEPLPLIRMANGYRKSDHGRGLDVLDEIKKAVGASAAAASEELQQERRRYLQQARTDEFQRRDPRPAPADHVSSEPIAVQLAVPASAGEGISLELVDEADDSRLIKISRSGREETIQINRAAPFMYSFANFPSMEIEPVLRLTLAVGLAEIEARRAGVLQASTIRINFNELLKGPLAQRTGEQAS